MAKTIYKENTYKNNTPESLPGANAWLGQVLIDPRIKFFTGIMLLVFSFALAVAFISYFFTGKADQSVVEVAFSSHLRDNKAENWLGLAGAVLAHVFIFKWLGIGAFLLVPLTFGLGWRLAFNHEVFPIIPALQIAGFTVFWTSLLLATLFDRNTAVGFWGGGLGYYLADIFKALIGSFGTVLLVLLALGVFLFYFFQISPQAATDNSFVNTLKKEFGNVRDKFSEIKVNVTTTADGKTKTIIGTGAKATGKTIPPVGVPTNNTDTPPPMGANRNARPDIWLEIDDGNFGEANQDPKPPKENPLSKTAVPKDKRFVRPNPKVELEIESHDEFGLNLPNDDSPLKGKKGEQSYINFEDPEHPYTQSSLTERPASPLGFPIENPETSLADLVKEVPNAHHEGDTPPSSKPKPNKTVLSLEDDGTENTTLTPKEDPIEEALRASDSSGLYDPTAVLSQYHKPTLELLDEPPPSRRQVSNEELEANKDKIVETLSNYGIGISQIKATIGPTVTLYEIIPEAGVRISKIKNLEDDIALSLAALGIRIIAPIPGKGTIGIEVPNKKREMVSMRSILDTDAFRTSEKTLPLILGKSITNEVMVADLAKMPHLLIAGATGQGKSVGLNVFLTSLIYKKHPAELKFVLVDPKKVELTLFNKIEKHFLAKLPDEEEAIITDTSKVIHTLNSLCLEMDNRYTLLKEAACRNISEYNQKFRQRRLNPKKGHKFLPYIVLVIDELADLMMVAGKEVEQPIARLAQLARAVGIHLIVATQRPSVNVITGIIKANFPARLSFKVTSKIDSRTILDAGGAEQLVGMGDFLFSLGSDTIRLQCPFLDTHEVERVCDFINEQQGFQSAYELPEVPTEASAEGLGVEEDYERDVLFEEAARIVVMHQQGSTSLLQRRLKLGYNRAGRLIDQLEKAGIVGAFEGSKAREVLIQDEYALERLLSTMDK